MQNKGEQMTGYIKLKDSEEKLILKIMKIIATIIVVYVALFSIFIILTTKDEVQRADFIAVLSAAIIFPTAYIALWKMPFIETLEALAYAFVFWLCVNGLVFIREHDFMYAAGAVFVLFGSLSLGISFSQFLLKKAVAELKGSILFYFSLLLRAGIFLLFILFWQRFGVEPLVKLTSVSPVEVVIISAITQITMLIFTKETE
jgi:hypothetical protein